MCGGMIVDRIVVVGSASNYVNVMFVDVLLLPTTIVMMGNVSDRVSDVDYVCVVCVVML